MARAFAARALFALLVTIGFYVLALGAAAGFFWLAYVAATGSAAALRLALFCLFAGGSILWSVVPRQERFICPGPQLFPNDHPELFKTLGQIARATRQRMPDEVYLVPDVNAWVAHRGGMAGVGTRSVMGLGLPLMQVLTLPQFRAVVAHEFGHYSGGDTRLAGWIYKAREAIGRTIQGLARHGIIHKPFLWYGKFFMRVTQALSREQEKTADRVAATVAGARNAADALTASHRAGVAYGGYWANEVAPLLNRGFRPPIARGFEQFLSVDRIVVALDDNVKTEMKNGKADPYDSHPPLHDRIRELRKLPPGPAGASTQPAVSLLRNLAALEVQLLHTITDNSAIVTSLRPIDWKDTVSQVYAPIWQKQVEANRKTLENATPPALAALAQSLPLLGKKMQLGEVPANERSAAAGAVLGCALASALHREGWDCDGSPGRPISFSNGAVTIEPFSIVPKIARGEMSIDAWREQCRTAGIEALTL